MKKRVISGIGHPDGAAALDLLAEDRDHRAGRAEHVAEANRDEAGVDLGVQRERLDDPLAHRLRLSHHVLRVRRLVGRDEDEALDAELDRDLGQRARREHVVRDRLQRVRLEHADVLVRRGVEEHLRPVALEHLAHLRLVAGVGEHRDRGGEVALVDELALDLEQRGLRLVDEHEAGRAEPRELAAELRADRAAGARDEHRLVLDVRRHEREVDLDLLAAEDVLDLHRPDLGAEVEVAGDQLVQARQRLHRRPARRRHVSTIFWRTRPGADGIAISTSSGLLSRSRCASSSVVPSTFTPLMRSPRLRGSSSTKPIGV